MGNAPAAATLSRTAHRGLSAFRPLRLVGIESICTTDDGRAVVCTLYSSMGGVMCRHVLVYQPGLELAILGVFEHLELSAMTLG